MPKQFNLEMTAGDSLTLTFAFADDEEIDLSAYDAKMQLRRRRGDSSAVTAFALTDYMPEINGYIATLDPDVSEGMPPAVYVWDFQLSLINGATVADRQTPAAGTLHIKKDVTR